MKLHHDYYNLNKILKTVAFLQIFFLLLQQQKQERWGGISSGQGEENEAVAKIVRRQNMISG